MGRLSLRALAFLLCVAQPAPGQTGTGCLLRGAVRTSEGNGIARAGVTAIQGGTVVLASTDSLGRFTVTLVEGPTTLLVRAIGFVMERRQIDRSGCTGLIIVMHPASVTLPAVRASAPRATPFGRGAMRADDPGIERSVNRGPLGPDQAGNTAAMLAVTPGVSAVGDADSPGFSVLGLPNDQSITTLNGARVDADGLPPDAGVLARVSVSPFDVSQGGFSGGELTLLTAPAGGSAVRRIGLSTGLMPLATPANQANMTPVTSVNGLVGDALPRGLGAFRLSWNGVQTVSPSSSLESVARAFLGKVDDSVPALLAAAHSDGLVATVPSVASRRSRVGSAMLVVDAAEWRGSRASLAVLGNWRGSSGQFAPGISASSHGGADRSGMQTAQASIATSFAGGTLSELTATAVDRRHRATENSDLPEVDVQLGDGDSPLDRDGTVYLGGNVALPRDRHDHSFEVGEALSADWDGARHLSKLTVDGRASSIDDASSSGERGAYTFASVGDFVMGLPSTYYWSTTSRASASQRAFALSAGDAWEAQPSLELQYGVRFDDVTTGPAGVMTGPWRVAGSALSPRAGFAWLPGRVDARDQSAPRGIIVRGGIGRFRATLPLTTAVRVAQSVAAGKLQVLCVGGAVPAPDWASLSSTAPPRACGGGQPAMQQSPADRTLTGFASGFQAPSAWRAALGGSFPAGLRFDVDATYSLGSNNPDQIAMNLRSSAAAILPDEGGRPMLVSGSDIDARTGIPEPHAGRADTAAAQVFDIRSNARSRATQLIIGISPNGVHRFDWHATYTYQRAVEQQPRLGFARAGFDQAGDPVAYDETWSRSLNAMRHQLVLTTSLDFARGVRLSAYYTGRSGRPYTPIVAGDVDGDGPTNDPAFVFDPASVSDSALVHAMRALLATAPSSARSCLRSQLGRVATRNSCVGPWSGDASVELDIPAQSLGTGRVTAVRFQIVNLLAGTDAAIHGLSGVRGWGVSAMPDPVLLRPAGFDAATMRFLYHVNPGFGSPLRQSTDALAPFSANVSVRFTLGSDPDRQQLAKLLDARPADSATIARRLGLAFGRVGVNPAAVLLAQRGSRWSDTTVGRLRTLAREIQQRSDSVWGSIASIALNCARAGIEPQETGRGARLRPAGEHPRTSAVSVDELLREVRRARDDEFHSLGLAADRALALLTDDERRALPGSLKAVLDRGLIERQRATTASRGRGG